MGSLHTIVDSLRELFQFRARFLDREILRCRLVHFCLPPSMHIVSEVDLSLLSVYRGLNPSLASSFLCGSFQSSLA